MKQFPSHSQNNSQKPEIKNTSKSKNSLNRIKSTLMTAGAVGLMSANVGSMATKKAEAAPLPSSFATHESQVMKYKVGSYYEKAKKLGYDYTKISKEQLAVIGGNAKVLNIDRKKVIIPNGTNIFFRDPKNLRVYINGTNSDEYLPISKYDLINIQSDGRKEKTNIPVKEEYHQVGMLKKYQYDETGTHVASGSLKTIDKLLWNLDFSNGVLSTNKNILNGKASVKQKKGEKIDSRIKKMNNLFVMLDTDDVLFGTNGVQKIIFEDCEVIVLHPKNLNNPDAIGILHKSNINTQFSLFTSGIDQEIIEYHNKIQKDVGTHHYIDSLRKNGHNIK
jgi:hypothetical protein